MLEYLAEACMMCAGQLAHLHLRLGISHDGSQGWDDVRQADICLQGSALAQLREGLQGGDLGLPILLGVQGCQQVRQHHPHSLRVHQLNKGLCCLLSSCSNHLHLPTLQRFSML